MSDVSKLIAELSPAKRELLAKRLRDKGGDGTPTQKITRRPDTGAFPPLSFAQQRLWILDQLEPDNAAYNIYTAIRLNGGLDVDAMKRSFDFILARHEALRTTFAAVDGQPVQVIAPALSMKLPVTDLGGFADDERENEVQRLASEDAQRPFNLSEGPLMRLNLLRLSADEYVLLLTVHHIVFDGWSGEIFIRVISALYDDFSPGRPSPLPPLPIQYADFAVWQREWLQGEVLEQQVAYWKRQLAGAPPVLQLPTDRPRPAVQTFRGERLNVALSRGLTEALKELSRREGATLFMTLLAPLQTLPCPSTGHDRISVGTPVASRNRREIQSLIGFFANTIVLSTDLGGNPTFYELLERVKEVTLGAFSHQELPFEKVVDALHPVRDLSYNPLFQVMLILNTAPVRADGKPQDSGEVKASGNGHPSSSKNGHAKSSGNGHTSLPEESDEKPRLLTANLLPHDNGAIRRDLSLPLVEGPDGLTGYLEYSTDIFDTPTIERMLGHLETLLAAVVPHPERRISDLPILTPAEQRQLLVEWTDTQIDYQEEQSIHELFEAQVKRTPDADSVIFGDERVSYAELNRRANRLAHRVWALGVGPEVMVAIYMERSIDLVSSILGVLKAGGAYVPLDPAYPVDRLAFMLEDARPSVLLTAKPLGEDFFGQQQQQVVCLETDGPTIENLSEDDLHQPAMGDSVAYVIYTSGSMGRPKGVAISHDALRHYVQSMRLPPGRAPADRYLHTASIAFSSSVRQLMVPLSLGATVVLATSEQTKNPLELLVLAQRHDVTIMDIVPSYWRNILHLLGDLPLAKRRQMLTTKLRLIGSASEPLWSDIPKNWSHEFGPQTSLINMFGQTETTGIITVYPIPDVHDERVKVTPIGRPIANRRVYVLDAQLKPVPVGVQGELHVGGCSLGRGYLNRPELTAEKLIPDPFSNQPGARLFKTGDLARYLPDGDVEFIGRLDQQVKIRGFRVEPEEIEAVLVEHPGVRTAHVMAYGEVSGDKRLAAYIVARQQPEPSTVELRQFLKGRVPEYMVPSAFVLMEALPRMPNGKIDRKALPAPDASRPELETSFVLPRNPIEETLSGIWARVLGVEQVGVHDNFFELGGHSLLATQTISRIREAFHIELSLRHLFEEPTVAGLSLSIETALNNGYGLQAPPVVAVSRDQLLPLSFAQQRLWFLDQLEPGSSFYNLPAAVRFHGQLNIATLERTLNEVIRRHEVMRTAFDIVGEQPVQIIAPSMTLSLPVVDLSGLPLEEREAEARRLIIEDSRRPFDLTRGPLVRSSLLLLSEDEYVWLLTMHHIISDEWSTGVLIRELADIYLAYRDGQPSPLAELPIQYADFAHWQREWLQGEVLDTQLGYWRKQLAGAPAILELPTDRPRPPVQTYSGGRAYFSVPLEVKEQLTALARREGATLFMTLLAAFKVLLSRYTGQEEIVVGTPIAGRNRAELEPLIGFFVNTLVLRTDVGGELGFREVLGRVREGALGAYAHQDLPFEKLVDELQPERDMSRTPLFQAMFVLQTASREQIDLPGLQLSAAKGSENTTAKFDLTLAMAEARDELGGALEYNTDLFDASTIERMLAHFRMLLEAVAQSPQQSISSLPLLSADERTQLLRQSNQAGGDYRTSQCLHELFEARAQQTPSAVALNFEEQQLTYAQLNERANQLAHHLLSLSLPPEALVAICLQRGIEMVVCMLAALKAGAAYLPLDPAYPQERLSFMLEDSRASVLIGEQSLLAGGIAGDIQTIAIDSEWEQIEQQQAENPGCLVTAQQLAYVIYTSGSTGRPKGVMVTHSNVTRLFAATAEQFSFDDKDVWTLFHSYAFDFSVWEMWGALLHGGRLVVVPYLVSREPEAFYRLLEGEQVTVLNQTPSAFRQLQQAEQRLNREEIGLALRAVIFGGEALDLRSLEPWMTRHGDERPQLINMYGITETTVHVTYRS